MIPQSEIDRINGLDLADFVTDVKRVGQECQGLCPRHNGHSLYWRIEPAPDGTQPWLCRGGCGAGGYGVTSFLMWRDGLSWIEAMRALGARDDGEHTPREFHLPRPTEATPRPVTYPRLADAAGRAVLAAAQEIWHGQLWRAPDALALLDRRGIPRSVVEAEGIGFATGTLAAALDRRGLPRDVAARLGLLGRDGRRERFAGYLTLPEWHTVDGQRGVSWVIARRVHDGPSWAGDDKYLCMNGNRPLIGLESTLRAREVIVTTGPFDRLVALSWGEAAVCIGNDTPSEEILNEVRLIARHAVLSWVPDADGSGRRGLTTTLRRLALPAGQHVVAVRPPCGFKDLGALGPVPDGYARYSSRRDAAMRHRRRVAALTLRTAAPSGGDGRWDATPS